MAALQEGTSEVSFYPTSSFATQPLLTEMSVVPSDATMVAVVDKKKETVEPKVTSRRLFYGVSDIPSWGTTILFGIQQILVCASGVVAMPLVVSELICAKANPLARVKLIGTLMFTTGFSTFLQSTIGTRLPLLQGPSFAFLPSIIALMALPQYQCKEGEKTVSMNASANGTFVLAENETGDEEWMEKMQVVQGGLIVAAIFEMLVGMTGLIGLITKYVGPLTIAPLMVLLEFSVVHVIVGYATQHWMSGVTALLLLIVAMYLHTVQVPLPTYSQRKCKVSKFPLFAVFPYLIGISIVWLTCVILTVTNVFDRENHEAVRTDLRSHVITEAPWFRWPYPFQWGWPRWNTGVILGMIAATLASIIESVGDYHACARAADVAPPPTHAVNRGILMEGFCCLIGGTLGGGLGVTTYSENIGVIGITKVASRRTMQAAGILFLLLGLFTKIGAVLATIPDPLVGGILTISCAMVGGVGLSSVQLVDLRLSRNTAILGFAIMLGIVVPGYFKESPVRTGNETADQVLNILLSINMFVGGVVGFVLDNTIPGATKRERGLIHDTDEESQATRGDTSVYLFSPRIMKYLNMCKINRFLPFMPKSDVRFD